MVHSFLVTNVESMRSSSKHKSSFNWRTGSVSAIVTASIVCAAYLKIAGVDQKIAEEPAVLLGSNTKAASKGHQILHAIVSGSPEKGSKSAAQNISSKLHLAPKLPRSVHKLKVLAIKGYEVRGPFPKIGKYGVVPQMNADIVDSMEDPQVHQARRAPRHGWPCIEISPPSPGGMTDALRGSGAAQLRARPDPGGLHRR